MHCSLVIIVYFRNLHTYLDKARQVALIIIYV